VLGQNIIPLAVQYAGVSSGSITSRSAVDDAAQPLASCTKYEYDPAATSETVYGLAAVRNGVRVPKVYKYGPVPPVAVRLTLVHPPLHTMAGSRTGLSAAETVSTGGAMMVMSTSLDGHPLPSATETV
jgi:hypothetical protein